ncbi:hypothetical protein JCM11251_007059 [Rhodosporidiobolus azoricus]
MLCSLCRPARRIVQQAAKLHTHPTVVPPSSRVPPEHLRHPAFRETEDNLASLPLFPTRGREHVKVLYEPREFYETLLDRIKHAKRRIFIASLYVGKEEIELVTALHAALRQNPSLRLTLLVDYLRSTRELPNASSASLLGTLAAAFPAQVDLRLFHTPALNGWQKRWVPKRFNEGWGLQHMKVYGVDEDVILSGANLSHDYFTNRTDRYLLFRNHSPLADYFSSLVSLISRVSFRATATDTTSTNNPALTISWPEDNLIRQNPFDTPRTSIPALRDAAHDALETLTRTWQRKAPRELASSLPPFPSSPKSASFPPSPGANNPRAPFLSHFDTSLRPVLQMGPFSITQETDLVVPEIFRAANALATAPGGGNTTLDWTSGYFGLREDYKRLVLECRAGVRIVSASPEANGFFNSRGVSRFIPPAYTYFAKRFYAEVVEEAKRRKNGEKHVHMREWKREGWTYHAKGIWLAPSVSNPYSPPAADPSTSFSHHAPPTDPSDDDIALSHRYSHPSPPFLTLLGSSNYGGRSATRDLEATLLLTTHDPGLRWDLETEVRKIREWAVDDVDERLFEREGREVPLGVRIAARAIETML